MRITALLILAVHWLPLRSFAQTNWKPGYVVLPSNDTLWGSIDYRNWDTNPETIQFQTGADTRTYQSQNITAFGITALDNYRSFLVTYYLAATELADAEKSFPESKATKHHFLRLIYSGKISLYELSIANRKYYFIQEGNTQPEELVYRVRQEDGQLYKDEKYKLQLNSYSSDIDLAEREKKINRLEYNQNDLVRYFESVYGRQVVSDSKSVKPGATIDVTAGLTFQNYYTGSGPGVLFQNVRFNNSLGYQAGAGVTFHSRRSFGRIRSRLGLNLRYLPVKGDNSRMANPGEEVPFDNFFFTTEPHMNISYVFNPLRETKFTLGAEFGYNIVVSSKMEIGYKNSSGVLIVSEIPTRGGFMSAGLNIGVENGSHQLLVQGGWLSDAINDPGSGLFARMVSLIYRYRFLKKKE